MSENITRIKNIIGFNEINEIEIDSEKDFNIYSYEGNDYILFKKKESTEIADLIELYNANVNYIFILQYKDFDELKTDINNSKGGIL